MRRYVLIGPAYPFRGGISHYTASLYSALAEHVPIKLVSYRRQYPAILFPGKTQLDESAEPHRVPNEPVLDPLAPWTWRQGVAQAVAFKPDAVVIMWWNPFFALMLGFIARSLRKKGIQQVVFLCHNVFPHESTLLDRALLRAAYRTPTHFLVQSEGEREQLVQLRPDARIQVIFHPAQTFFRGGSSGQAEARRHLAAKGILPGADSRALALFFGHIRHYKGVDTLLEALALAIREIPLELLLVGEFYEPKERYDRQIESLGLSGVVHVVDRYIPNEEVGSFFEAADVVVLPYRSGTQSGVVPLAYRFRRPVIVGRVGGIPEAVIEGQTGLLVEPEDPAALAAAIVRFFREDLAARFAPHLDAAAERHSWSALVGTIEQFLCNS